MQNSPDLWLAHYPFPKAEMHKYDRGHALIYGGAVMTGAARLAARAAQRAGAGVVTLASPATSLRIYAAALESAIIREVNDAEAWKELLNDPKRNAVLIGPGIGLGNLQAKLTLEALESRKPCVLDADALTNFASNSKTLFSKLHENCILTPHEGEFSKLFSVLDVNLPKTDRAVQAAKMTGCIILLKGADTVIASPDGQFVVNNNAPPWTATAGAGDVLGGIILGLIAQKMPLFWAASAAAWIHGAAAAAFGLGMIAEDLIEGIPATVQKLMAAKKP